MNTIEAIKTRYSCRAFSDKMPSDADLQTIAAAAVAAPSAMNAQPWQVIVVTNRELLAELEAEAIKNIAALPDKGMYERITSRGGNVYYNTPCQIIIGLARSNRWQDIDCGIITQNIALAATDLGMESLICGMIEFAFAGDKGDYFKEKIGILPGYSVGISILLGYAQEPGGVAHQPDLAKISVVRGENF